MIKIQEINEISNSIHEWSQPEQSPWKTIVLTRAGGVACAAIETCSIMLNASLWLGMELPCFVLREPIKIITKIASDRNWWQGGAEWLPDSHQITKDLLSLAKIITGLASTIFFGIIFCPELNFRIHLKLGLAVDNLAVKREKDLRDKLEAQAKAEEIKLKRAADLQMQRSEAKAEEEIDDERIDSELAELLLHQSLVPVV